MINKLKLLVSYISKMNKTFLMAIVIVLISIVAFSYVNGLRNTNSRLKTELVVMDNNYTAKLDTITKSYNKKTKEVELTKGSLLKTREEFKKDTSRLGKEIKKLNKNTQYYLDVIADLQGKTGDVDSTKHTLSDSIFKTEWTLDTKEKGYSQNLAGYTISEYSIVDSSGNKNRLFKPLLQVNKSNSFLTKNNIKFSLSFNHAEYITKDGKKQWKVTAKTPSKRLTLDELNSVYFFDKQVELIKEKPSPWSFGPSVSYGVNQDGSMGLNFGVSLQYNLFNLFKK